jgi:hypothetical protein
MNIIKIIYYFVGIKGVPHGYRVVWIPLHNVYSIEKFIVTHKKKLPSNNEYNLNFKYIADLMAQWTTIMRVVRC